MNGYKVLGVATATATALGLLLGNAAAGSDNDAYVTQTGNYNQASIEQSGNRNQAGSTTNAVKQTRWNGTGSIQRYNTLTILQSGDDNEVGLEANANPNSGVGGIDQRMPTNSNGVSNRNVIAINQSSNGNVVGAIYQLNSTHRQGDMQIDILQAGTGGHRVGSIHQFRGVGNSSTNFVAPNKVDIKQYGANNTVERILQRTAVNSTNANSISVRFEAGSSSNGNGAWTPGGAAAATGAFSSTLVQGAESGEPLASGNSIVIKISGAANQYGVSQLALAGSAAGNVANIAIDGSSNELGAYQQGHRNTLVATITQDHNIYGVKQIGEDNSANLTVSGNGNGSPSFSGFAASVSLAPGLLVQDGLSNAVSLNVDGSNNAFASLQVGNANDIVAGQKGAGNQAAVSQTGNSNTASLSQNGASNNVAIIQ